MLFHGRNRTGARRNIRLPLSFLAQYQLFDIDRLEDPSSSAFNVFPESRNSTVSGASVRIINLKKENKTGRISLLGQFVFMA
jgi:hypothetical protein